MTRSDEIIGFLASGLLFVNFHPVPSCHHKVRLTAFWHLSGFTSLSVIVTERVVKSVSTLYRMVEKRRVTDLKSRCKSAVFTGTLHDENIVLNVLDHFLLFVLGTVCVDIHRRLNILVSHDRLNHLQIRFVLTKSGAESMS